MKSLILFSHGSVLCGSGRALDAHAERLRQMGEWSCVEVGYLNYCPPPFLDAVAKCCLSGATELIVVPFFLVPGYFVTKSLPLQIEEAKRQFPSVEFKLAAPIGFDERLADAIIDSARSPVPHPLWRSDIELAPYACRAAADCPLYETINCPASGRSEAQTATPSPYQGERPRLRVPGEEQAPPPSAHCLMPAASPHSLLIMVHGSPHPEANNDMYRVVDVIRQRGVFERVEAAFMECNQPEIGAAIDSLVESGATRIVAVPYFLHTGMHVADDLPTLLEAASDRRPNVEIQMGKYIGASPLLTEILASRAALAAY